MATPRKNEIADAAGMRRLTEHEQHDFAGMEGPPEDGRIADLEVLDGIAATLVLCDSQLGIYWHDQDDNQVAYALFETPRLVRELVAERLLTWHAGRHREITEDLLLHLGFQSIF